MIKRIIFTISILFLGLPISAAAIEADNFIWPLGVYNPSEEHGYQMSNGLYHMGVDVGFELSEGDPVYAIADGVVKEAQERSQFGLVVLIEHTLPNGKKIVSLYGHMRPSDIPVTPGTVVKAGDRIGSLAVPEENGGWPLHLHWGIYKTEYTGEWVYYGHVSDPEIADQWYSPHKFVPKRMNEDLWAPSVSLGFSEDVVINDVLSFYGYVGDRGSGVESVTVKASDNGKESWETIASYSGSDDYPYSIYTSLSGMQPGRVYIKIVATDVFGNKTKETSRVVYKPDADTTRHFVAFKGKGAKSRVKILHQDGSKNNAFRAFEKSWTGGGDIAVGDVTGDGASDVITVKGDGGPATVRIFSRTGTLISSFDALSFSRESGARVALGDIDGDGTDEIIIGSGPGKRSIVKAFEADGTLIWRKNAFKKNHAGGVDVASGDFDGDGIDEVVVGAASRTKAKIAVFDENGKRQKVFRAFQPSYKGGVNLAAGDIDNDGQAEIIIGSGGDMPGRVKLYESGGKRISRTFNPFGNSFTGPVDVAVADWEQDGKYEIIMSQAGEGEAWVKTYRSGKNKRVMTTQRVFAEGFEGGARIAGWD